MKIDQEGHNSNGLLFVGFNQDHGREKFYFIQRVY